MEAAAPRKTIHVDMDAFFASVEQRDNANLWGPPGAVGQPPRVAEDVWAWCETAAMRGRTVTVKVKWSDFQQSTRSRSLTEPVASKAQSREISLLLVRSLYPPIKGVRLVGVTLSNLDKAKSAAVAELALS